MFPQNLTTKKKKGHGHKNSSKKQDRNYFFVLRKPIPVDNENINDPCLQVSDLCVSFST